MSSHFSLLIGLRYLSGARRGGYLSFISTVSFLGLSLGVMVLTIVVSVMNGFDAELRERILGAVPHVVITETTDALPSVLANIGEVRHQSAFMDREALLLSGPRSEMALIHGIEPGASGVGNIADYMVQGGLENLASDGGLILGTGLASRLGLQLGDSVTVLVPEAVGHRINPRIGKLQVTGLFQLKSELDYRLAVSSVSDLARLSGSDPGLRLELEDVFGAPAVTAQLLREVDGLAIRDWTREHGDFFEAVKMEKVMMFVLLSLIVVVAAFNIISSLSIMVNDRQAEISVLKTMGASRSQIMLIFICQGGLIGLLGCLAGLVLGIPAAYAVGDIVLFFEGLFGGQMLAGTYFSQLPSEIRFDDIVVILLISLLITLLATLYPAYRAAQLEPAIVLRAE